MSNVPPDWNLDEELSRKATEEVLRTYDALLTVTKLQPSEYPIYFTNSGTPQDPLKGIEWTPMPVSIAPGYHLANIKRGEVGEASKIKEETDEFMDSVEQGASIMALVELADLIGAVKAYLAKHHPSMTLDDLLKMQTITERAFRNGYRR